MFGSLSFVVDINLWERDNMSWPNYYINHRPRLPDCIVRNVDSI